MMDRILEAIAKELDSKDAGGATISAAMIYVHLCNRLGLETPDWVRALGHGNSEHIMDVIDFARDEKKANGGE